MSRVSFGTIRSKPRDGRTHGADCQQCFGVDIGRRAPVLLESPRCGIAELIKEGCCKLSVVGLVCLILSTSWTLLEALQLCLDAFVFVAGAPHAGPINNRFHSWGGADGLQHPLSRVGACWRGRASLTDEVVDECFRISTNVAEVDRPSTCRIVSKYRPLSEAGAYLLPGVKVDRSAETRSLRAGGSCKVLLGRFSRVW